VALESSESSTIVTLRVLLSPLEHILSGKTKKDLATPDKRNSSYSI
jgi:hypothetical protein